MSRLLRFVNRRAPRLPKNASAGQLLNSTRSYFSREGWRISSGAHGGDLRVDRANATFHVIAHPPNVAIGRATVFDWTEIRLTVPLPLVVICRDTPDLGMRAMAAESGIVLCHFAEIATLEKSFFLIQEQKRVVLNSYGVVDGFDFPATIRGFCRLTRQDGSLAEVLKFQIVKFDSVVAEVPPSIPRPDITGSMDYLAGFRADCSEFLSVREFLMGSVEVRAVDSFGVQHALSVWNKIHEQTQTIFELEQLRYASKPVVLRAFTSMAANETIPRDIRDFIISSIYCWSSKDETDPANQ